MRQLSDYHVFIFDCDGVILDSNALKIKAMQRTLEKVSADRRAILTCIEYFRKNFGRSRFHHINTFVQDILNVPETEKKKRYEAILSGYSEQCKSLYLKADITPGFLDFVQRLQGNLYVASGSEQEELRFIFKQRGLDPLFSEIYGSPDTKQSIIANIIDQNKSSNVIMFGDALSDMSAAESNAIDFVAYLPFSNVSDELKKESDTKGFPCVCSWEALV